MVRKKLRLQFLSLSGMQRPLPVAIHKLSKPDTEELCGDFEAKIFNWRFCSCGICTYITAKDNLNELQLYYLCSRSRDRGC